MAHNSMRRKVGLVIGRENGERVRLVVPPSKKDQVVWVTMLLDETNRPRIGLLAAPEVEILREELVEVPA